VAPSCGEMGGRRDGLVVRWSRRAADTIRACRADTTSFGAGFFVEKGRLAWIPERRLASLRRERRVTLDSDREELVRMFVLDTVADDYEDFPRVVVTVGALGRRCGLTIGGPEVLAALEELVRVGWVTAWRLSPTRPAEVVPGVPERTEMDECYFLVSEAGARRQAEEFAGWPFAEDGGLRADWRQPGRRGVGAG